MAALSMPADIADWSTSAAATAALMQMDARPCPFCSSTGARVLSDGGEGFNVYCRCGAVGPTRHSRKAAFDSWNSAKR